MNLTPSTEAERLLEQERLARADLAWQQELQRQEAAGRALLESREREQTKFAEFVPVI